jgi:hypothetical protein
MHGFFDIFISGHQPCYQETAQIKVDYSSMQRNYIGMDMRRGRRKIKT